MGIRELIYTSSNKYFREWPSKRAALDALDITIDELNRRLDDSVGFKTSQGRFVYEVVEK